MHASTLVAFIILDTVLCFIPGMAVMAVIGAALTRKSYGFATALGILTGNGIYFVISGLGLISLIVASHGAFMALKWCGAGYLAFLGVRSLLAKKVDATSHDVRPSGGSGRAWLGGTITQLANPKALVFISAILPQFIDTSAPVIPQVIILGIASLSIELVVLSIYVFAVDAIRSRGLRPRGRLIAERVGGACLLGIAMAVVAEHT